MAGLTIIEPESSLFTAFKAPGAAYEYFYQSLFPHRARIEHCCNMSKWSDLRENRSRYTPNRLSEVVELTMTLKWEERLPDCQGRGSVKKCCVS